MTNDSKRSDMEKSPRSPGFGDGRPAFVFPEIQALKQELLLERSTNSAPTSRSCSFKKSKPERLLVLEAQRRNSAPFTSEKSLISISQNDLSRGKSDSLKRVRSFKMTPKGIVNKGDAFRTKSSSSLASAGSTNKTEHDDISYGKRQRIPSDDSDDSAYTTCSCTSSVSISYYRVGLLGSDGVGKSALINQFMTSEYLGASDITLDIDDESTVSVMLDGEESMIEFSDISVEQEDIANLLADAYVVVFSVDNRTSFEVACATLHRIRNELGSDRATILVANKIDLVRKRLVSSTEARGIADVFGCKYIETSLTLNHHVDELLVGLLRQIRLKLFHSDNCQFSSDCEKEKSKKAKGPKGLLNKIFRKSTKESKCCENLLEL